jgi:hypothetical protein
VNRQVSGGGSRHGIGGLSIVIATALPREANIPIRRFSASLVLSPCLAF